MAKFFNARLMVLVALLGISNFHANGTGLFDDSASTTVPFELAAGLDRLLMIQAAQYPSNRLAFWRRDFSSVQNYEKSVQPNREHLRQLIGAAGQRLPNALTGSVKVAKTEDYTIFAVRWPVLEGITGEGLWLKPKEQPIALAVAIPDADQTPELIAGLAPGLEPELQFARRLVENGCEVLVPTLINRQNATNSSGARTTHRDWITRQSFQSGHHIIGYEVQKVLSAVDCLQASQTAVGSSNAPNRRSIGLVGYGEGALLAFFVSALDTRIDATVVSGYFETRVDAWNQPISRTVFGLAVEFGDAEIATLIAPRALFVEHAPAPVTKRQSKTRFRSAFTTPEFESVESEINRAQSLLKRGGKKFDKLTLVSGNEGRLVGPIGELALTQFLEELGSKLERIKEPGPAPQDLRASFDSAERQNRQLAELINRELPLFWRATLSNIGAAPR